LAVGNFKEKKKSRGKLQLLNKGKENTSECDFKQVILHFIDTKIAGTMMHFKLTTPTSQQANKGITIKPT